MSIILIIIAIFIIYAVIAECVEKRKQNIRDRAARNVLEDFDFQKEKKEILTITKEFEGKEYRCPLCNGVLISRLGRFGQFWGCSNYPNCKFTKNKI